MAGFPTDKTDIDTAIGSAVVTLREAFRNVQNIKTVLDTYTQVQIENKGYSTVEAQTIINAFADLNTLAQVANGQATQATLRDFFVNARKLTGLR